MYYVGQKWYGIAYEQKKWYGKSHTSHTASAALATSVSLIEIGQADATECRLI